jgi:hypothetical protein
MMLYRLSVGFSCCALSGLSPGAPAQKTAERTSIEMANDGANDFIQVVSWI